MQKFQKLKNFEWPTFGLIVLGSCAIVLLTLYGNRVPLVLALPLLAFILALMSSLQHEALHGHPFKSRLLNEALVFVPVGLFIPYQRFRDTHIQHHFDPNLTDPYDDPETNFLEPQIWQDLSGFWRFVLTLNNSLAGRMLIGPLIGFYGFYKADFAAILARDRLVIRAYLLHFIGLVPVIIWLSTFNTLPVWAYITGAYAGISLLKIRTFLEHRAHENSAARTVIIEDRGFFAFLFLNNNFHAVHHQYPGLAWYKIPENYQTNKAEYLTSNKNYHFTNYRQIFREYFFKSKDQVPHPIWNSSNKGK